MTTTCQRHNNVIQFLEVSKTVKWLDSSPLRFGKKSFCFEFCFKCFSMKDLKGAILSQNHRGSQGVLAQWARAPSIEMPPMAKI